MIGDLHAGREQEEAASGVEAATAVAAATTMGHGVEAATAAAAATTMGHGEEAEALINQAANLVAELQPNDYLFTTDVKTIATLVYVAAFLSKLVPVTAAFKGKEALQQALWRVVQAPWNSPSSTHVRHVVPPSASQGGRPYLVPLQYITDRRNAVLEIMVPLSQLPGGLIGHHSLFTSNRNFIFDAAVRLLRCLCTPPPTDFPSLPLLSTIYRTPPAHQHFAALTALQRLLMIYCLSHRKTTVH